MACSSVQAAAEGLEGAVAAVAGAGQQASGLLEKAIGALSSLHGRMFPQEQAPASLGELAELFGPDGSASDNFRREHTVRGSQTTLLMLLGHGFEGDFDKAMSGLPCGPDGKPMALSGFPERSRELAQKLTGTLEKQAAKRAEKAKKSASSQ